MFSSLDIDAVARCVKNIIENVRCLICDKLEGKRLRYTCGHAICDSCVTDNGDCVLCLTPPRTPIPLPIPDQPLTERVLNAVELLSACQDTFQIDVNKRLRLSEQLRIEKEVFPECIQAPVKYSNIRRSLSFISNKENYTPLYPGEKVSPIKYKDMENNFSYVHQWLDKNDRIPERKSRSPFAAINVNNCNQRFSSPIKTRADLILSKVKENIPQKKSRSHLKTINKSFISRKLTTKHSKSDLGNKIVDTKTSKSDSGNKIVDTKHSKNDSGNKTDDTPTYPNKITTSTPKHCREESGIEIDDETIVLHDSQSEIIDKDKLAWLAVIEADKLSNSPSLIDDGIHSENAITINKTNVPFIKKSRLYEVCMQCKSEIHSIPANKINATSEFKPVSITIDCDNFTTTIKISKCSQIVNDKKSTSIQTDMNVPEIFSAPESNYNMQSEDLFTNEIKNAQVLECNKIKVKPQSDCLVIEDSDSDFEESSLLEVTADVHRSSEQRDFKTLAELDPMTSHSGRKRPRGHTPNSTDSSEKENYDPNRNKRAKNQKKLKKK